MSASTKHGPGFIVGHSGLASPVYHHFSASEVWERETDMAIVYSDYYGVLSIGSHADPRFSFFALKPFWEIWRSFVQGSAELMPMPGVRQVYLQSYGCSPPTSAGVCHRTSRKPKIKEKKRKKKNTNL
ncbi:hypothetical protein BDV34DRAFT_187880 [Aspergillus parasiticus]|uniref:Uncharacterized protein n=1 Tax=Aspergillus parasiticus TaxID=5067 RepID=A0A5N6E122_ASPPA|nr:hypothetical protein BDV34DRAFT_187880 [Aspergillus parasiticus]